jgi:D-beta-D-heptose 7-phosphate kinase/D-beta-D-heptose 1-phosphate adenosyltransferase
LNRRHNLTEKLLRLIETLGSPRILVVGELILDRYVWGKVERVSPEAPIPVLHVSAHEERLGGAGCVINNLVTLGADVACCSVLGSDQSGRAIIDKLEKAGVTTDGLQIETGRDTVVKTRMIGFVQSANRAAQHIMRMDEETANPLGEEVRSQLLGYLSEKSAEFDAVLISDYDKGLVDADLVNTVVQAANKHEIPVLVDPRRSEDLSLYRGVTAITPNRFEAALATGIDCHSLEGIEKAGRRLLTELEVKEVAITIDKEGIYLCRSSGDSAHFDVRARNVYDVTGAGDMVLSAFGLAFASGAPVEDAVALANLAAGVEVAKLGAAPVSKHELFEAVSVNHVSPEGKLRKRSEIRAIADAHRSAGETVVFTNGCFDILHPGHVDYLQFARSQGDVLIVGLNSDKSVREIKGKDRPVMDEEGRAVLLGALESVTHVVLFDEPTPKEIVGEVRPDILVKGEDWREKGVVGRELVESYGGRVVLAKLVEGHSTSGVIEKIKKLGGNE